MLWPPLLSAPLPLPGPRRGERTCLGSGLRLHDCVQCEEIVHLLIKMLRVWTRRGRGGHHHPGCGSGLSKRRWHTGLPSSSRVPRASGRACALPGVFRGEGLAWILSTCTCLGMSSCLLHSSVWECACGHPATSQPSAGVIRSGTRGKAPLVSMPFSCKHKGKRAQ